MSGMKKGNVTTAYKECFGQKKSFASVLLALGGVYALSRMLHLEGGTLGFTNSVWTVFMFAALFCLMKKVLAFPFEGKMRRWLVPGMLGTAFSFCMIEGVQLDLKGSVPFTDAFMWLGVLAGAVVLTLCIRYFWELLAERQERSVHAPDAENGEDKQSKKEKRDVKEGKGVKKYKDWLAYAASVFLMYLPVFLAVYPGFFVYDAQDELMQVITRNFSTHHPLVHVILMGGIVQLGYKLSGSYNVGIACYTIFQMLVMAGIFGWCVYGLKKHGANKVFRILCVFYFGLCPILVMFSLCSAKDGLFAGMLLIMTVLLTELLKVPEKFFEKRGKLLLFGLAALGMMLLRHNGFYAFLVFVVMMLVYLRKYWQKTVFYFAGIIVVYLLVNGGLAGVLHADASENQEMLTVPIMQLSRVYDTQKDQLPAEEKEILYRYLPEEALARYTPKVSDGVKIQFDNQAYAEDAESFWKLWISWGVKNPFTYLNAWFMTSYGFWYPDTVIDVYRGNTVFTYTYEDSSYFGYEVEQPGIRESKIPGLSEIYRRLSLEIYQQKLPVVSMLFSPGFLFWVLAFVLGFWCYQGAWGKVMAFMPVVLCWLTVLLGPTYLVRYVVYLWAVLPVLLSEFDNCTQL